MPTIDKPRSAYDRFRKMRSEPSESDLAQMNKLAQGGDELVGELLKRRAARSQPSLTPSRDAANSAQRTAAMRAEARDIGERGNLPAYTKPPIVSDTTRMRLNLPLGPVQFNIPDAPSESAPSNIPGDGTPAYRALQAMTGRATPQNADLLAARIGGAGHVSPLGGVRGSPQSNMRDVALNLGAGAPVHLRGEPRPEPRPDFHYEQHQANRAREEALAGGAPGGTADEVLNAAKRVAQREASKFGGDMETQQEYLAGRKQLEQNRRQALADYRKGQGTAAWMKMTGGEGGNGTGHIPYFDVSRASNPVEAWAMMTHNQMALEHNVNSAREQRLLDDATADRASREKIAAGTNATNERIAKLNMDAAAGDPKAKMELQRLINEGLLERQKLENEGRIGVTKAENQPPSVTEAYMDALRKQAIDPSLTPDERQRALDELWGLGNGNGGNGNGGNGGAGNPSQRPRGNTAERDIRNGQLTDPVRQRFAELEANSGLWHPEWNPFVGLRDHHDALANHIVSVMPSDIDQRTLRSLIRKWYLERHGSDATRELPQF